MFDDFTWRLGTVEGKASISEASDGVVDGSKLRYVGGVDLSFAKEDSSFACGALVVMDLESMQVVYEDFDVVQLTMPYVAGFLAFREVLHCLPLFRCRFETRASSAVTFYVPPKSWRNCTDCVSSWGYKCRLQCFLAFFRKWQ